MSKTVEQKSQRPSQRRHRRIRAEWVTFTITSLIVAVLVGLVLFAWFTQEDQPPILALDRPEPIRIVQDQYYVPFTVTNTGGGTAESVQVLAELRVNGEVEESGEQQLDFLSGGEKAEGAFVFSRDPRDGDLNIRVASYKLP